MKFLGELASLKIFPGFSLLISSYNANLCLILLNNYYSV